MKKNITINLPSFSLSSLFQIRFILLFFLFVLLSVFGYWYKNRRPYLRLEGAQLEAFSTIIHSDQSGRISLMGPEEGDFVKKGQKLFSIEKEEILKRRLETKKRLQTLEATLKTEKARSENAMQAYIAATSDVEQIEVEAVEKQIALMDAAQSRAEKASKEIVQVKKELEAIDQEFRSNCFAAPFSGTILKRSKNPGSVISFGEPLYVICDTNQLWIEAEIPEKDLCSVSKGTEAKIRLSAYPKKEFKGAVSYIGPATVSKSSFLPINESKKTIPIKISIESENLELKPGLSASIDLKVR